jgi:hypothetical protein
MGPGLRRGDSDLHNALQIRASGICVTSPTQRIRARSRLRRAAPV